MRYAKGKWIASYRDTFSLDYTLSPIILASLIKFREQSHKDMFGYPSVLQENFSYGDDYKAYPEIWEMIIDKMIYAFDLNNEPKIKDYDFTFSRKDGKLITPIKCTNINESNRYDKDIEDYQNMCKEGYELFGKYFKNLWW